MSRFKFVGTFFRAGHEILVIDNFATGKKGGSRTTTFKFGRGIYDQALVDKSFDDFSDFVIHSAASYKDPR